MKEEQKQPTPTPEPKKTPAQMLADLEAQEKQLEANLHHVRGAIAGLRYALDSNRDG